MKKAFLIVMICASPLYAQIQYNQYQMNLVTRFIKGSAFNELGYNFAPVDSSGPISLTPTGTSEWKILDVWNDRVLTLNSDFEIESESLTAGFIGAEYMFFGHDEVYIGATAFSWNGLTSNGETFFALGHRTELVPRNEYRSYWYHNDVLFIHDRDNRLVSIREPSAVSEENRHRFLDTERTRALFEPDSGWDPQGLSIDEQDRLFLDGDLVTLDYRAFLHYFSELHSRAGNTEVLQSYTGGPSIVAPSNTKLVGRDNDGNWYWNDNMGMLVFNNEGVLLDFFLFKERRRSTLPAVSPEGDIYVMHYAQDTIDIYRVDRQW